MIQPQICEPTNCPPQYKYNCRGHQMLGQMCFPTSQSCSQCWPTWAQLAQPLAAAIGRRQWPSHCLAPLASRPAGRRLAGGGEGTKGRGGREVREGLVWPSLASLVCGAALVVPPGSSEEEPEARSELEAPHSFFGKGMHEYEGGTLVPTDIWVQPLFPSSSLQGREEGKRVLTSLTSDELRTGPTIGGPGLSGLTLVLAAAKTKG